MLSTLLWLPLVSAASIRDVAEEYCAIASHAVIGTDGNEETDEQFYHGKLAHLFADTLDCSGIPGNAEFGYDLKGVTIDECMQADLNPRIKQVQLAYFKCLDIIADEDAGQVEVIAEMGNTGKYGKKFNTRASNTLYFENGKIVRMRALYDPTNWEASPIRDALDSYCSMTNFMAGMDTTNTAEIEKTENKLASLYASTVDCSSDPNNPVLGYDLKGVPASECFAADANVKVKRVEMGPMKCIDTIADEQAGKGAVFFEMSNTGKYTDKFSVRVASRFTMENGLITSYHDVYDSYHVVPDGVQLAGSTSSVPMVMGGVGLFAIALVAGMKFSNQRKVPLLENEVVA